jgi:predicted AAA+ superfamily ATPase
MIKRESYFEIIDDFIDTDFIKIFTGIRRSGKTTLLYSIIDELKKRKVPESNIIFISFESEKYQDIYSYKELNDVIHSMVYGIEGKIYLFFDEIQEVENWEKSVNSFRVDYNCDIYVTGSNSKLLLSDYSTLLAGRFIQITVYPFSFKEFLKYNEEINDIEPSKENIKDLFQEYVIYGGMPGLLTINNKYNKKLALSDIYSTIILNDVMNRHPIRKPKVFKKFAWYIISTPGETFSADSIVGTLKNFVQKTSRDTITNYMEYLEEAFFIYKIKREDLIGKKIFEIYDKYYIVDQGFHQAIIGNNMAKISHILENIVFLELLRRGYHINVGFVKNKEVDFVCERDGKRIYIQVSYLLASPETIEREFKPLLEIPDKYDSYVLSMDEFDMSRDGIKHMNIIEFLLDDEI